MTVIKLNVQQSHYRSRFDWVWGYGEGVGRRVGVRIRWKRHVYYFLWRD